LGLLNNIREVDVSKESVEFYKIMKFESMVSSGEKVNIIRGCETYSYHGIQKTWKHPG